MEFISRVCDECGTVNAANHTRCITCGKPLPALNASEISSIPTFFSPSRKLLKQRYRAIHVIGKGGMGTVFLGEDTQLGNRLVAIKQMSQNHLPPLERLEAARNFRREAHLLAGLQHPNLPSIYDHFEEDQRWYLVMSFVKGQPLADYLDSRGGRLPVVESLEISIVLCSVLKYLHSHQPPIIFRDLKPSNIMRAEDGHIYLIDFGIARFFKPEQAKDTANQGTSGYAAPEQYGIMQTTPRSDIYSLGATLYQMLSGYEPANTPFLLPPLQWYVPEVPLPLLKLIDRMLDLEESKRPPNVEVVRQELQSIRNSYYQTAPLSASPKPRGASFTPPVFTPAKGRRLPSLETPLGDVQVRPAKRRRRLILSAIITGVVLIALSLYLVVSNLNLFNADTPYGAVNAFCNALNSQAPDYQTAYRLFSRSYQRQHTLVDFEEHFQGILQCLIASSPDTNNQAVLNVTFSCPHGPRPAGGPPPGGPPGIPPPSKNPVNVTLLRDGSNGWKIDVLTIIGYICGLPPDFTPPA